ncbi:MAG: hypothetical protein WC759_00585, partial [Candidatus Micrarchaeia archaeon]
MKQYPLLSDRMFSGEELAGAFKKLRATPCFNESLRPISLLLAEKISTLSAPEFKIFLAEIAPILRVKDNGGWGDMISREVGQLLSAIGDSNKALRFTRLLPKRDWDYTLDIADNMHIAGRTKDALAVVAVAAKRALALSDKDSRGEYISNLPRTNGLNRVMGTYFFLGMPEKVVELVRGLGNTPEDVHTSGELLCRTAGHYISKGQIREALQVVKLLPSSFGPGRMTLLNAVSNYYFKKAMEANRAGNNAEHISNLKKSAIYQQKAVAEGKKFINNIPQTWKEHHLRHWLTEFNTSIFNLRHLEVYLKLAGCETESNIAGSALGSAFKFIASLEDKAGVSVLGTIKDSPTFG